MGCRLCFPRTVPVDVDGCKASAVKKIREKGNGTMVQSGGEVHFEARAVGGGR